MALDGEPYAIPVNHAYKDGRFYFHCATTGRKLDIIGQNPNVSYVITRFYGDRRDLDKCLKCHGPWESVIAYGKARVVSEHDELIRRSRRSCGTSVSPTISTGRTCSTTPGSSSSRWNA